jgi:predicted hotdog family 3-hydroxylacyl-ACP dehydratase
MIEKEELLSFMPHRGRMLLLDRIKEYDMEEHSIEAEYLITEDCLFYDSAAAGVPAWVGFEFIAQAISAFKGLKDRAEGKQPGMGFILSVSQMRIDIPFFPAGNIIEIKAKEICHMDSVYTLEGEILLEGRKALEGKLTVIDVDDEQAQAMREGRSLHYSVIQSAG